jgi:hypothetical protein
MSGVVALYSCGAVRICAGDGNGRRWGRGCDHALPRVAMRSSTIKFTVVASAASPATARGPSFVAVGLTPVNLTQTASSSDPARAVLPMSGRWDAPADRCAISLN